MAVAYARPVHSPEFRKRRTQNWLVLGLTYAAMYMARYNFPLANKALSDTYGWDKAQVGTIITAATLSRCQVGGRRFSASRATRDPFTKPLTISGARRDVRAGREHEQLRRERDGDAVARALSAITAGARGDGLRAAKRHHRLARRPRALRGRHRREEDVCL